MTDLNENGQFEMSVSRVRMRIWMKYLHTGNDVFSVHYRKREVLIELAEMYVHEPPLTWPLRICDGTLFRLTGQVDVENVRAKMAGIKIEEPLITEVIGRLGEFVMRRNANNRNPISVYIHLVDLEGSFLIRQHEDFVSFERRENELYLQLLPTYFPEQHLGANILNYQEVLLPPLGGGAFMRIRLPSYGGLIYFFMLP